MPDIESSSEPVVGRRSRITTLENANRATTSTGAGPRPPCPACRYGGTRYAQADILQKNATGCKPVKAK